MKKFTNNEKLAALRNLKKQQEWFAGALQPGLPSRIEYEAVVNALTAIIADLEHLRALVSLADLAPSYLGSEEERAALAHFTEEEAP